MTNHQNPTRTKPNLTRMAIVAGVPLLILGIVWYVADPRVGSTAPPPPIPIFEPLRLTYEGQRGVLTVFDAPNPPDEPRPPAYGQTADYGGYLAIWRGYNEEASFIFGRLLYTEVDLGLMLLSMEQALGVDVENEFELPVERFGIAIMMARDEQPDQTEWFDATQGTVAEMMGFPPTIAEAPDVLVGDFDADGFTSVPQDCQNPPQGSVYTPGAPPPSPAPAPGDVIIHLPPRLNCCQYTCTDTNPCTRDWCNVGICTHTPLTGTPCADGDNCTTPDECVQGQCTPGPARDCDDGNPCTTDTCVETTPNPDLPGGWECEHSSAPGPCDDGDLCTTNDHCHSGACVSDPVNCDDDGNNCTVEECQGGQCVVVSYIACQTDDPCKRADCSSGACQLVSYNGPCDDDDPCTVNDVCTSGECRGEVCPEQNLCQLNGRCVDNNGVRSCQYDWPCDDNDACTVDSCDPISGSCTHNPLYTLGGDCIPNGCVIATDGVPAWIPLNNDDDNGDGLPDYVHFFVNPPPNENDTVQFTFAMSGCPESVASSLDCPDVSGGNTGLTSYWCFSHCGPACSSMSYSGLIACGYPTPGGVLNLQGEGPPCSRLIFQSGTNDSFGGASPDCCTETTDIVLVPRVENLNWEKAYPDNADLDTCPNNGGVSIFPDKLSPNDPEPDKRRKVKLVAQVQPPIPGVTVHFRVLDVDDPFDQVNTHIENEGLIDGDSTGSDNRPSGTLIGVYEHRSEPTDSNGRAEILIEVSMQPGNNYRAAASLIPEALTQNTVIDGTPLTPGQHADRLSVTPFGTGYAPNGGFSGYEVPLHWSPMLTIWRALHLS